MPIRFRLLPIHIVFMTSQIRKFSVFFFGFLRNHSLHLRPLLHSLIGSRRRDGAINIANKIPATSVYCLAVRERPRVLYGGRRNAQTRLLCGGRTGSDRCEPAKKKSCRSVNSYCIACLLCRKKFVRRKCHITSSIREGHDDDGVMVFRTELIDSRD